MKTDSDLLFDPSATFADDDPLAPVHAFFGEVRDTYGRLPAPEPRGDLAARFRDESEPAVVIPLRPPHSPVRTRARRFRRAMLVAATLAVAIVATGGLAAAGALPDSMQNTVADILDRVGIDVPHGQSATPPPPLPLSPNSTPSSGAPAAPRAGNAGAPSSAVPPTVAGPDTAPDSTVAPTSTTAVPGVPAPLPPVDPDLPIDVPLPPLPIDLPIDLPTLPVDLPLPPLPIDPPALPVVDVPLPPLPDLPTLPIDLPTLPVDLPLPVVRSR